MAIQTAALLSAACVLLGGCCCAAPAVFETSGAPSQLNTDTVRIAVPSGEFCHVTVLNADKCEPHCPEGVEVAQVSNVFYSKRVVFAGTNEEHVACIPYYLPAPGLVDGPQNAQDANCYGSVRVCDYGVRLHVSGAERAAECQIDCGNGTVTVQLDVYPPVAKSDMGFGFYNSCHLYGRREQGRANMIQMRDHGCNTFTPYGDGVSGKMIADQVLTAFEVGLIDGRFPLQTYTASAKDLEDAVMRCDLGDRMPLLIEQNCDEPALGTLDAVTANTKRTRAAGGLSGTAISGKSAWAFSDLLDVVIIHMDGASTALNEKVLDEGGRWWAYNCTLRGTNAPLHRYQTGAWPMAYKPDTLLLWGYMHQAASKVLDDGKWNALMVCEHALSTPDGPMDTVGLEGFSDGVLDYRCFSELARTLKDNHKAEAAPEAAQWLDELTRKVIPGFWPNGEEPHGYFWDVPDLAKPPVDGAALRAEALQLVQKLKGGG